MNVYLLCSAILVIAYFLLANNVSRLRAQSKIGFVMAMIHRGR